MSTLTGHDPGLDLSGVTPAVERQITNRLLSRDFDAWSATAARVGHCSRPIRLHGSSTRIDAATGEVLSTYSTDSEALGVLHVRSGNRRASVCPSCSRVYAADTFHLIRARVIGGKTVPETVADNPLVFATLTAPSFGHVHRARSGGKKCRPWSKAPRCPHGRPTRCTASHSGADRLVGQPICGDCYDYASHVIWQWWAPELWRRFTIALRRAVASWLRVPPSRLKDHATVQYAKVAEYQRRGVVHFHALIRLDGPRTDDGFAPAPAGITANALAQVVAETVAAVRFEAPRAFATDPGHVLAFGSQVDARPVHASHRPDSPEDELSAEQVAGYLAKYATKAAADTVDATGDTPHLARLRSVCRQLAGVAETQREWARAGQDDGEADRPYALLGKWAHMLGFRGHFSTKSRRYSITLGQLRRARRRWQVLAAKSRESGTPIDVAELDGLLLANEENETTLVVGHWQYLGTGWASDGEAALATAAAVRAREYAQQRAATNTGDDNA